MTNTLHIWVDDTAYTYHNGTLTTATGEITYSPLCTPYYVYWNYPEDRVSRAFRVVRVLMDKKIVVVKSIRDFTDLVDEISRVI